MNSFEKVYEIVASIPKGKVLTYKQVGIIAGINNPRIVGFALHANKNPQKIPCHRVIRSDGKLAKGYAFGGKIKQMELLEKEGIIFSKVTPYTRCNLQRYIFRPSPSLLSYFKVIFDQSF